LIGNINTETYRTNFICYSWNAK